MKFEGIGFNLQWIKKHKTEKEFVDNMNSEGQKHILEGDPKRNEKLKALYAEATKPPAEEAK